MAITAWVMRRTRLSHLQRAWGRYSFLRAEARCVLVPTRPASASGNSRQQKEQAR